MGVRSNLVARFQVDKETTYFICLHLKAVAGSYSVLLIEYGFSRSIDVGERSFVGRSLMMAPCPPICVVLELLLAGLRYKVTNCVGGTRQHEYGCYTARNTEMVSIIVGVETVKGAKPLINPRFVK